MPKDDCEYAEEKELVSEILPLEVANEIIPALLALPELELEYDDGLELSSEILPLEVEKDIAPPFPALPESDSA